MSFETYALGVGLVVSTVNEADEVTLLHTDATKPFQTMSFQDLFLAGLVSVVTKSD